MSRLSFDQIAGSQAYQTEAAATAKANITVATAVAICVMVFSSWGFGFWWMLVLPALWFAVSLCVAMPFMLLRTFLAARYSDRYSRARGLVGLIDFLNYVVLIPLTYFSLFYLHDRTIGAASQ